MKELLFVQRDTPSLDPEFVGSVFGYPLANSTTTILLITLLMLVLGIVVSTTVKRDNPSKFQIFLEMMYSGMHDFVAQIIGKTGGKISTYAISVLVGLFMYLIFANIITFIPGLTSIMVGDTALFRTPTADFNTTLGLAAGCVLAIQLIVLMKRGPIKFVFQFVKLDAVYRGFKKSIGAGFGALVDVFVGVLDAIGEVAKIVSLSLRLFGNMFAGNVLAVILMGALAYVVPAIWMGMNLFFSLLQALVFAALVSGYYMLALQDDEDHDELAEVS